MDLRLDIVFRFLQMKSEVEEEQRKSLLSRKLSKELKKELDERYCRIDQLGALSAKIIDTIKKEREEKRKLQLQYCPETMVEEEEEEEEEEHYGSDDEEERERNKLFEDDLETGGVKLYVQNTSYKQIVLNVKDLTDICDVTTDAEAEKELTSLDTEETKKKKKKTKKASKTQSKSELPSPPAASQTSKRKKKKKKQHNDSLSDDDPLLITAAPEGQRITLTEADIDTLTQDFDEAHALKLRQALEDLMRAQGVLCEDTEAGAPEAEDVGGSGAVADASGAAAKDIISDDDGVEPLGVSSASSSTNTTLASENQHKPTKKKKGKKKKATEASFDVNDVD